MSEPNVPILQTIDQFMDSLKNPQGWLIVNFSDEDYTKSHNLKKYDDILKHPKYELIDSIEFDNHIITPEMILPPNLKYLGYSYDIPAFSRDDVIKSPVTNDEFPELPEGLKKLYIGVNDLKNYQNFLSH